VEQQNNYEWKSMKACMCAQKCTCKLGMHIFTSTNVKTCSRAYAGKRPSTITYVFMCLPA